MKIGYPCLNRSIKCTSSSTFRLKSYTESLLIDKITNNLDCLWQTLQYNLENNISFFRISSDLIPFASHSICTFDWKKHFQKTFSDIGTFIKKNKMRISMHPDQFTLINSKDNDIFLRSEKELAYHADILDLLGVGSTAKIQIHVGGVYGDKRQSLDRFIKRYKTLSEQIRRYLVIENDEKSYSLKDCMEIYEQVDVPVLFDVFHHSLNNNGESLASAFEMFTATWKSSDGIPMVDYSSQAKDKRKGSHTESIDLADFNKFIKEVGKFDFDVMLEIKDKEKSALKVIEKLNK